MTKWKFTIASLKTISDQPVQNALTELSRSSDGSLLGIYNGQIQKYSPTLNYMPVCQSAFGTGKTVVSFTERNDTVFATGVTIQKQTFYGVLDRL